MHISVMLGTVTKLKPLAFISPSRYYSLLQCRLREVFLSSGLPPLLPVPPPVRLGSVIHSFFESVVKAKKSVPPDLEYLESTWASCESRVEEAMVASWTESHLVPLRDSVPGYEVKKRMAFRTALKLSAASTGFKKFCHLCEVWYQSRDGLVRGRVDSVIILPGGGVILEDYKTGPVAGPGGRGHRYVKPEYSTQMKLYASLFWETAGLWPVGLRIVGLDGTAYMVSFTPQECIQLLDSARRVLVETNSVIRQVKNQQVIISALATPGPDTCQLCLYRPACKPYWDGCNILNETLSGWPHDIRGSIANITRLGNGRVMLAIKLSGCKRGELAFVRGIQLERHAAIKQGASYVEIYNLVKEGEGYYKESPLTTCYNFVPYGRLES